eukprot:TRINITY_DN6422_c0_g1_i14.p1 TRINITY_DN6422_c0_g1~~TRINITY_DN6422_c0_g1_i14.p1  ORF type:complete len:311 (+),score=37.89 TRINITY_DN6422_c0_g1_i14:61-933(+)
MVQQFSFALLALLPSLAVGAASKGPCVPRGQKPTAVVACTGHGYTQGECSNVGCCKWVKGACWASDHVGAGVCATWKDSLAGPCEEEDYESDEEVDSGLSDAFGGTGGGGSTGGGGVKVAPGHAFVGGADPNAPVTEPPTVVSDASSADKTGACINNKDVSVWNIGGGKCFNHDLSVCGKQCWGNGGCVKDCVMKLHDYTPDCASCFGDVAFCSLTHCSFYCATGQGEQCTSCNQKQCSDQFLRCSGFQRSQIVSLPQVCQRRLTEGEAGLAQDGKDLGHEAATAASLIV